MRQLADSSRNDKEAKLISIYEESYSRIARYLYAHIGDRRDAEDLASEAFVKALRSIDSYEERGLPMEAWIFRIARNLMVDYLRHKNHYREIPIEDELVGDGNPEQEVADRFQQEELREALKHLTPAQREVISLRFFAGLSAAEVGEIMGKSAGAVREMQSAALKSLRRIMVEK